MSAESNENDEPEEYDGPFILTSLYHVAGEHIQWLKDHGRVPRVGGILSLVERVEKGLEESIFSGQFPRGMIGEPLVKIFSHLSRREDEE